MKFVAGLTILMMVSFFVSLPETAGALGLKVAPLGYKESLKANEQKKGFIDISNPVTEPVNVGVSVQSFRQIDDDGGLQFYDDKQIAAGITPELADFELGPREAIRLYFTIDSNLLPEGDVYAAILFTTAPTEAQNGIGQSVRVGTLLSLTNKTPGVRKAEITGFKTSFLQFSDVAKGEYRIRNTGPADTGFYPTVKATAWPSSATRQIEGPLVFGGRERSNDFTYKTGYGIHRIDVSNGESTASQWVVSIAPWMIVLLLVIVVIIGIELLLLKKRRKTLPKI